MYGGYVIFNAGAIWLAISLVLCGVSQTWLTLVVCRALQGLALGALLPSGMMILGSTYRPGPRKNLVFCIYDACAALAFFAGFFVSGICAQYLTWRWYFFIGAILSAIMAVSSLLYVHRDFAETRALGIRMDWVGFCLSISGTTLFVFAIADSSYTPQGWRTPYIPVLFAIDVTLLGFMTYLEAWVIDDPLLPGEIFRVKYMTPLILALLCLYGSLGIFLLYGIL
jgi:MFS family permease